MPTNPIRHSLFPFILSLPKDFLLLTSPPAYRAKLTAGFFLLLSASLFLLPSPTLASGIRVTPAFQDITTENQAIVNFSNQTQLPANFTFSLVTIQATDLLGRLQFNAPLPQTIKEVPSDIAVLTPQTVLLDPNQTATVSAQFFPEKLNPGTTAFLLLAKIDPVTNNQDRDQPQATLEQYIGSTILITSQGGTNLKLELTDVEWSWFPIRLTQPDFLTITLKNTGNTRTIPSGVLQVKDLFGREIMRGALNQASATILPGSQRLIYGHLQPSRKSWPITVATLTLSGSDESRTTAYEFSRSFLYLHPGLIAALLLLILASFYRKKSRPQ